ncbi:MAG: hypothetical protein KAK04_23445 [Cyclobacteriaceae bacterium]|nr:hypothetical protein [Cyclobacteriaceae bacterium]
MFFKPACHHHIVVALVKWIRNVFSHHRNNEFIMSAHPRTIALLAIISNQQALFFHGRDQDRQQIDTRWTEYLSPKRPESDNFSLKLNPIFISN